MSRAVANTLLPAARPASTIARPRPRELPVTNHICAIHPPLSSHPSDILEKLLKLRIGCAMFPVILERTPYGKDNDVDYANHWVKQGYVVILQDVRGRFNSDGV